MGLTLVRRHSEYLYTHNCLGRVHVAPILTIIGVTDERVGTIRTKRGSTGEAVGFKLEDTGTGLTGLALTH